MKTDMQKNQAHLSRRSFLALGSIAALGGAAALTGCGTPKTTDDTETNDNLSGPSFMQAPSTITDIAETKEFDVVVIGAGAAGVPAALSAREKGASVACLQKESQAISQGNTGTGIDLSASDPAGVEALVSLLIEDCQYRASRDLINVWAQRSGEAVKWVIDRSLESGASVEDQGNLQASAVTNVNGYSLSYVTSFFGPKPLTVGDGMRALSETAQKDGVEFFYSTPAEQLVVTDGAVTGVIAKGSDGYIQFNAAKGVILATGDYQNDEEMSNYYQPDVQNFMRKQSNKTGDGHKMGLWAGALMEDIAHTKMLHDFDAGPATMCDMPFLTVADSGKRFCNETVEMSLVNNFLRQEDQTGWYSQIFDANYMTQAAEWPGRLVDPTGLENYMPDVESEKTGVFEELIRTFRADTLEELATKLDIDPTTFEETVARYNELVAQGADEDFGKPAQYLHPIDTPPFFGIHRWLRVSALCSGLVVDANCQCLDAEGSPIEGLFAAGNVSGGFYGGIDYPMTLPGLSLGRCYTQGRVTGQYVAGL